jgi:hypothetical protein
VRRAERDTLVISDGFSCRQQISDGAHRWALHPAEVIALALDGEATGHGSPEHRYRDGAAELGNKQLAYSAGIASLAVGLLALGIRQRR